MRKIVIKLMIFFVSLGMQRKNFMRIWQPSWTLHCLRPLWLGGSVKDDEQAAGCGICYAKHLPVSERI